VVRSRNKKDLVELLDSLCILVDNPVVVLDQEESKKFILGKSTEKYDFFGKATELTRVDKSYKEAEEMADEIELSVVRIEASLLDSGERVERLKREYDEHRVLARLNEELQQLNTSRAWAYYASLKEEYRQAVEKRDDLRDQIELQKTEIVEVERAVNESQDEEQQRRADVAALVQDAGQVAEEHRRNEDELRQLSASFRQAEQQLRKVRKRHKAAVHQLAKHRQELQEARDQIAEKSEEARLTAELEETEAELGQAQGRVETFRFERNEKSKAIEDIEPKITEANGAVAEVNKQLGEVNATLHALHSSSGNSLAVFGPRVAALSRLVSLRIFPWVLFFVLLLY